MYNGGCLLLYTIIQLVQDQAIRIDRSLELHKLFLLSYCPSAPAVLAQIQTYDSSSFMLG